MKTPLAGMVVAIAALTAPATYAASVKTDNFVVTAQTQKLAEHFAQWAEYYRREKALEWLGREMPRWRVRCPLRVVIHPNEPSGATSFTYSMPYGRGPMDMVIRGPVKRLRDSVLPHEVTHTVFAHKFGRPLPRWADEGGSVLSENTLERRRHDRMCRATLRDGRCFRLANLFRMQQYPRDMLIVYAQGYSVCRYLVEQGGRAKFLDFLGEGLRSRDWDGAVRRHYQVNSVNELEREWIAHLSKRESLAVHDRLPPGTRTGPDGELRKAQPASRGREEREPADLADRVVVRDFSLPAEPRLVGSVTARGSSATIGEPSKAEAWNHEPRRSRPRPKGRLGRPGDDPLPGWR